MYAVIQDTKKLEEDEFLWKQEIIDAEKLIADRRNKLEESNKIIKKLRYKFNETFVEEKWLEDRWTSMHSSV